MNHLTFVTGKRQCNISNPCVISKLWRASFQLEVNPHSIHNPNIIDPSIIDPSIVDPSVVDPSVIDPSIVDPSMIDPTIDERDKVVNAKLGNNRPLPNIGSIFRFGKPQVCINPMARAVRPTFNNRLLFPEFSYCRRI